MSYIEEVNSKGELTIGILPKSEKLIYIETKNIKLQGEDLDKLLETCKFGAKTIENQLRRCLKESFEEKIRLQKY